MNNKTTLTLMEQLLMLLFFAAAAAICLQIFVYSHRVSEDNRRLSAAVSLAENAAELWSAGNGDSAVVEELWSGTTEDGVFTAEQDGLTLTIAPQTGSEFLGAAEVCVYDGDTPLVTIPVRWQIP